MIGEDARYTHYLGEFDYAIHSRSQLDVTRSSGPSRICLSGG